MAAYFVRRVLLLVALVALPAAAYAQEAVLTGTVTDSTGAVIAGAKVKVASTTTGREVTATCGDDGSFSVLSLPPAVMASKFRPRPLRPRSKR